MPLAKFLSQKAALTKTKPLNLSYHYAILGSPTAGSRPYDLPFMRRESTGTYETTATGGETVRAFMPRPLPPAPRIRSRESLGLLLEEAATAVGRLDAVTELLPNPNVFVYGYVRKEAVLSSRIEGTQSSLADLMLHEAGGVPAGPTPPTSSKHQTPLQP